MPCGTAPLLYLSFDHFNVPSCGRLTCCPLSGAEKIMRLPTVVQRFAYVRILQKATSFCTIQHSGKLSSFSIGPVPRANHLRFLVNQFLLKVHHVALGFSALGFLKRDYSNIAHSASRYHLLLELEHDLQASRGHSPDCFSS